MQRSEVLKPGQRRRRSRRRVFRVGVVLALGIGLGHSQRGFAAERARQQNQNGSASGENSASEKQALGNVSPDPEANLAAGIQLTGAGKFAEAIPYLEAARGRVDPGERFAADFDLSLCYVAEGKPRKAIPLLVELRKKQPNQTNVLNLLAQAYVGAGEAKPAMEALEAAASENPKNEKLYLFVADACTANREYRLGVDVTSLGLRELPDSARLHYEQGVFYSYLGSEGKAELDFRQAVALGPGEIIGFMAAAQESFLEGNLQRTIRAAQEGLRSDKGNYVLLAILGSALLRSGATPGEPAFEEAFTVTRQAVAERPQEADSQVTLGRLYLMAGKTKKAIAHLEEAMRLDPENRAACMQLATAYRQSGDMAKAKKMFELLARLNERKGNSGMGDGRPAQEIPHPRR